MDILMRRIWSERCWGADWFKGLRLFGACFKITD